MDVSAASNANEAQGTLGHTASYSDDLKSPGDILHKENVLDDSSTIDSSLKSEFDNLSFKDTVWMFQRAIWICFWAAFAASTDGYQIGINGNIIANQGFINTYGTTYNSAGQLILAAPIVASWSGVQSAGQIIGMTGMSFVAERFGRKWSMYGFWAILCASIFCETFGRHWPVWLVAKLFAGIGVGSLQFLVPTYITEIAPVKIRGALLLTYSFWYGLGGLFAPLALQRLNLINPQDYLVPIYTEWVMIGVMFIVFIFLPESPWWCAKEGRHEQGRKTLAYINGKVKGYDVDHQYRILLNTIERERRIAEENNRDSFTTIFKGVNGFRTLVSLMPGSIQQLTGLTLISTYAAYFFQSAGQADPFLTTTIVNCVKIGVILIVFFITDKVGRRPILLWGSVMCWVALMIIGGLALIPAKKVVGEMLVLFACLWQAGSTILGAMCWVFVGETASSRVRARTAGFSAAGTCVFGVIFIVAVPYMLNVNYANWGLKTAFFFAGVSTPAVIAAFFLIPETAGRSPAELDELFEKKVRPWRFAKIETDVQKKLKREMEEKNGWVPTPENRSA